MAVSTMASGLDIGGRVEKEQTMSIRARRDV